jgi:gas vesicle protein
MKIAGNVNAESVDVRQISIPVPRWEKNLHDLYEYVSKGLGPAAGANIAGVKAGTTAGVVTLVKVSEKEGVMIMKEELGVKKVRTMLVPFLAGGLVGAGVALLLAPKSGRELRKDIRDIAASTGDTIATTVEKGKKLYVESTAAVKNAIEAGKMAYAETRENIRKAA